MPNKRYNVYQIDISTLLHWIKDGNIGIHEMQRPFVWKPKQVRDLIDSLYRGYPIGFIVTWENPDAELKNGQKGQSKQIIIDGQQRITALSAALEGNEVVNEKYLKERIIIAFNPSTGEFATQNAAIIKDLKWIPDISIFNNPDFSSWSYVPKNAKKLGISEDNLGKTIDRLKAIAQSQIGVINLDKNLPIDQVTDIFNRINQKGTKLSSADFAMSRLSADNVHHGNELRKEIEYFIEIHKDPTLLANIKETDPNFVRTDYFKHIMWAKNENSIIFQPDFSDLLHICLGIGFARGKLAQLVSLVSGRDFAK